MPVTWDSVRTAINAIAAESSEWAGFPMPIAGKKLVIEPRHPNQRLHGFELSSDEPPPAEKTDDDFKLRNSWFSHGRQADVYIFEEADGRITKATVPIGYDRGRKVLDLFQVASQAWSLEAELEAQKKLRTMVSDAAWKYYVLFGMFLETSPRSRVQYVFRKLAPTIALGHSANGDTVRVLTTLCLHPIGYYADTPCGVMVPTDDVIAHLTLMRGDEHGFWKKANHHPIWRAP